MLEGKGVAIKVEKEEQKQMKEERSKERSSRRGICDIRTSHEGREFTKDELVPEEKLRQKENMQRNQL